MPTIDIDMRPTNAAATKIRAPGTAKSSRYGLTTHPPAQRFAMITLPDRIERFALVDHRHSEDSWR
jgi:hypothetical protein